MSERNTFPFSIILKAEELMVVSEYLLIPMLQVILVLVSFTALQDLVLMITESQLRLVLSHQHIPLFQSTKTVDSRT